MNQYEIPEIDLLIVDLYPFEQTVADGATEQEIIEKTFRKYGIEGPIRFRRYVEVPEW